MIHPERIRDKMEEQKDAEQTSWVSMHQSHEMKQ
jgi:hypothetical protein